MFLLKSFLKMKTEGTIFIIPKTQILGFQLYVSENLPMSNFEGKVSYKLMIARASDMRTTVI